MSVLFMMPRWTAVSELWLQRMIESLEPDVSYVAAPNPPEALWRGRIPSLDIADRRPRLWRRAARKAGFGIPATPPRLGKDALVEAIESPLVERVLVQYLDVACMYDDVWPRITKPLFIHCHGHDTVWDARHHDPIHQRYHDADYTERALRLASKSTIIANSRCVAKRLLDLGVAKDRVHVKYFGVPIPDEMPRRAPRTKGLTVLFLGRLVDCKGPDLTIRAFEIACDRGFDGRLVIAGDGPMRVTCELQRARSKWRDRIEMAGVTDWSDGPKLRAAADLFTAHNCMGPISRMEEAFGVSVIEALAAGLPVVSGRSGGLPENVTEGVTGFLVEPGDVEAHADRLLELARNPELRLGMGEAAWRDAKARFSVETERASLRKILGLGVAV